MRRWYRSWTVLTNVGLIGVAYWFRYSSFYVDPLTFVWIVAAVNLGLRARTSHSLVWRQTKHPRVSP